MDGETRLFVGDHYEVVVNGTETKYYFAGTSMIALRKDGVLNFIIGDHLGSTSLVTDANGTVVSEMRYKACPTGMLREGEVRHESGASPTEYTYTGQYSYTADFGLMFYNSRWYDPSLGRFAQADTIIPSNQGVQAWDRYAYTNNNPVRYTDPTGHVACSLVAEEDCSYENMTAEEVVKKNIKSKYGITMSDEGEKPWSLQNLRIVFLSLQNINNALNGKLKSIIGSATWKMAEYRPTADCTTCTYRGWTTGTNVTFHTMGNNAIHQMNIYHEFGHVLDNSPGLENVFSRDPGINNRDFLHDGYLSRDALIDKSRDMYQNPMTIYGNDPIRAQEEHWADIFANYVSGNINLSNPNGPGIAMYNFVTRALSPYIGVP
jgi:RHS repeat-associated protein